MFDKTAICILTSNYFKNCYSTLPKIGQYENIIKLLKQINQSKYDVYIYCNFENNMNQNLKQQIYMYFQLYLNANIHLIFFSYKEYINKYPEIQKFKLNFKPNELYIGICNYVLIDFYNENNFYKSYIFWEDDLTTTMTNFIYDDISDDYDIVLFNELELDNNWYWYTIKNRDLKEYEHHNGIHQLYCTYKFSNKVFNDIITIIKDNCLFGHHEDVYSNVIQWLVDNKHYTITDINKEFPGLFICSHQLERIKNKLEEKLVNNGNYDNLIIHPIKSYDDVMKLLFNKTFITWTPKN